MVYMMANSMIPTDMQVKIVNGQSREMIMMFCCICCRTADFPMVIPVDHKPHLMRKIHISFVLLLFAELRKRFQLCNFVSFYIPLINAMRFTAIVMIFSGELVSLPGLIISIGLANSFAI